MSDSELLTRAENLVPALQTTPDQVFTPMAKAIAEELSARDSTANLPITRQLMNALPGS